MNNSKEIVNLQDLLVLNVGYQNCRHQNTYPRTKYYHIIERVHFFKVVCIIYQYIFILAVFIYSIMELRLYYTAFVLTIQKRSRFEPGPSSPFYVATPLLTLWFEKWHEELGELSLQHSKV